MGVAKIEMQKINTYRESIKSKQSFGLKSRKATENLKYQILQQF